MITELFQRPMRVLHLEDNKNDHSLVVEMLRADSLPCELLLVETRTDFESALQSGGYDLILSDFSLPAYDGLSALTKVLELSPQTPFIFFSGTIGEDIAVESLKRGATDYILKQRPQRLVSAVRNALQGVEERLRRQSTESELRQVEDQFIRAQRLESFGALAAGIAHDLNNSLVPIIVGVDVLRAEKISEDAKTMLQMMETSARHSADMIKQLLAFVRGGGASRTTVHADELVKEMGKIVAATFPKSIQRRVRVADNCWPVLGLPWQLNQVLLNLCVNARDAMPKGGTIELSAENVNLTPAEIAGQKNLKPGAYLCIGVADTGVGIAADQLGKLFHPFYTTKMPGKGTGLGLSTCQSIARNHGGFITVHSKINSGTEFRCYLPALAAAGSPDQAGINQAAPPVGKGERILVINHEETILAIIRAALENYGYRVTTRSSGLEAVARFSDNPDDMDLVITDLAMPFMDGPATITALQKIRPDVRIIIAGGSETEIEAVRRQVRVAAFVVKPFTNDQLLKTVYEVLNRVG